MKTQMKVYLEHHTPLSISTKAIRTCWDSGKNSVKYPVAQDNIVQQDIDLMDKVLNKFDHTSTMEHLYYNFRIVGISRALLQELVRTRIASYSVKSTRYTIKELKNKNDAELLDMFVKTGDEDVDKISFNALKDIRELLNKNKITNDVIKYALPESFKTELMMSINARSLCNLIKLRSSSKALKEYQILANLLYINIPYSHKFLFKKYLQQD